MHDVHTNTVAFSPSVLVKCSICSHHPLTRTLRMNGSRKRFTAYDTQSYYFIIFFIVFHFFIFFCFLCFFFSSSFLLFSFFSSFIFFFYFLSVVRADAKTAQKRREVLFVKVTIFLNETWIWEIRLKDDRELGMVHWRVTPLSFFFHFCFFSEIGFLSFFFLVFLSNMFHCWHWHQTLTVDVSSVVGAPWRCGVLTT